MSETLARHKELHSLALEECPDSVERCPVEGVNLIACGTYQLLEQDSEATPGHLMNRKGSVMLFSIDTFCLKKVFSTQTEAILDCKWKSRPHGDTVLCTADAKGMATFYSFESDSIGGLEQLQMYLREVGQCQVAEKGLLLSLDWAKDGGKICASDSNGCLSIVSIDSGVIVTNSTWNAHSFEAWITAFNIFDENTIFSGGDDCKFCGWDTRTGTPIFKNSTHGAGVCSIQCNPNSEFLVATGSYDEYVRIWDTRSIRRQPMSEIFVGGGVWRIKWHPDEKDKMLTACMFSGFKVLNFANDLPKIVHSFNTNEGSLAYGVDWCKSCSDSVAGCTFYDRKIGVWKLLSAS